jgi:predicted DsbA family dithiol-disulfide isomerase
MPTIQITEYTDPTCPFAWNAEPARRRVEWLYGDQITIAPRMVGLSDDVAEMEAKGFTPEMLAKGATQLAHAHHMPTDTAPKPRLATSMPACRAVVATRLHAPDSERAVLRALRVRNFSGELVDEPATLRGAATDAGIDPDELERWLAEPATEQALREDLAQARTPTDEAVALRHKLASTPDGGHRYTCPSWELRNGDGSLSVPGFQPTASYEVAIANLAPGLERRPDPQDVAEVLRWAGEPLATVEVAEVCGIELDEARERLGRVATEDHIGFEGLWTLTA